MRLEMTKTKLQETREIHPYITDAKMCQEVSEISGVSKKDTRKVLDALKATIITEVFESGNDVRMLNFGTFTKKIVNLNNKSYYKKADAKTKRKNKKGLLLKFRISQKLKYDIRNNYKP